MDNSHLNLNLEENALDSLIHGIEHYLANSREADLKYALLHIAQAIELFLKARLAKEHRLLIYARPEISASTAKTVSFEDSVKRLLSAGINIPEDMNLAFADLHKLRNQIQHYQVKLSKTTVKNEIGRVVKFLIDFLKTELNIILEEKVKEDIYKILTEAIYSYKELEKLALEELAKHNAKDLETELCPNCGHYCILFPDPRFTNKKQVKCFFCKEILDVYKCHKCGVTCFLKEHIYHDCSML